VRRRRDAAPRSIDLQVKLNEEERDTLRAKAAELKVSVPKLLVESALSDVETPTDRRQHERGHPGGRNAVGRALRQCRAVGRL
jgi:hypothetical protein